MKKRLLSISLVVLMALMILPSISFANTTYTEWTSTTTLPTTSGAYKLTSDVTITNQVTIGAWSSGYTTTTTVTLDLNGHTVKLDGSNAQIYIQNTGMLIIKDSVGTGLITNEGATSNAQYPIQVKGKLQIDGGTLENALPNLKTVYVQDTASVCTLNGGTIINSYTKGGQAVSNKGTFIMNGGKVENKAAGSDGLASAINGHKVIITGGTIEAAGTGIEATGESVEITGGTIKAGWFGLHTRYATIKPEEGKTVKITAGRAAIIAYSAPAAGKGNKIYGGTFDAPTLMESKYVCDATNTEIYGGLFTMDPAENVAPGYIVNYPVFVDDADMYEVKLNKPYVTQDAIDTPDGDFEMLVVSEVQGELEKIFEKEIEKNEALKEALLDGKSVNIQVQMEELEEKDIKEEELKAIKEALKDGKIIDLYDITLAIIADRQEVSTISEISNKLKFKVLIPEDLLKDGRTFFMYRYHNGKVEKLTGELDEENYFIFESDKFSTYALAYEDKVEEPTAGGQGSAEQQPAEDKKDETPKTGAFDIALYVLGAIVLVSVVGTVKAKKPGKYSK
ncbi:MAG: hypothetical protein IJB90_02060 [Clostridia bacterium]|nr:hypothetical protein [Clostridia bacterium]